MFLGILVNDQLVVGFIYEYNKNNTYDTMRDEFASNTNRLRCISSFVAINEMTKIQSNFNDFKS